MAKFASAGENSGQPGPPWSPAHSHSPPPWPYTGVAMVVRGTRVRRWQWALAVFLLVVGFVSALQFRAGRVIRKAFELPTVRVRDLAVLVRQQQEALTALQSEVETLRGKLSEYEDAAAQGRVSADTLANEVGFYKLVLGLTSVRGPGVLVLAEEENLPGGVVAPSVQATDIAGLVNELWAAGAEAIAVNGRRTLATTGFKQDATGIVAGVFRLRPPYEIEAVGNPEALKTALSLRGGFVDGLRSVGVAVEIRELSTVVLPPYRGSLRFRYAIPARP